MIRRIPLIGELPYSQRSSIVSATKEMIYSTIFSTSPIWFFPSFSALFLKTDTKLMDSVYASVAQGDLYIFASSLVGPLLFAITASYASWGDENPSPNASKLGKLTFLFPYGTWFFIISILVCSLAAMCFGLMRFSTMGAISAKLNEENLFRFSIFIYLFSLFCLFCVSVYRNELTTGRYEERDGTHEFVDKWKSRNG